MKLERRVIAREEKERIEIDYRPATCCAWNVSEDVSRQAMMTGKDRIDGWWLMAGAGLF
jgi:hypothetical protein